MVEKGYIEGLWEVIMSVGYTRFFGLLLLLCVKLHMYMYFLVLTSILQ